MNPVRISEKATSPSIESIVKHDLAEEDENQKMAEYDRNSAASPPIESLVENIEAPPVTWKPFRLNGLHVKRLKMGNEELDHIRSETEDDCAAFGRCVTAQLKQMPKIQKLLAERLISEVCFRGQMQSLQMNTTLTTPNSAFHQHQPYSVYVPRPAHFNRGSDYMMTNQQGMRPHVSLPLNANAQQYQNFVNVQQQTEHTAGISSIVNMCSNENMQ